MLTSPYYIISISEEEYSQLRQKRKLSLPKHDDLPLEHGIIILIFIEESNKIIAEYDIDDYEINGSSLTITLEPIYNSPTGVKLTDLVLLTLTSYTLKEWKKRLETTFIEISERDFDELIARLKR